MFSYQFINHPESFTLDESRIVRIFELVSVVPLPPGEGGIKGGSVSEFSPVPVIPAKAGIQVLKNELQSGAFATKHSQNGILNIAFLPDTEIQSLNRDHRGIDKTTDVLSFHYYDDFTDIAATDTAGEIILSESRIISQAIDHRHTAQKEAEILILHSILHILGYDHETDDDYAEMWEWEGVLREKL